MSLSILRRVKLLALGLVSSLALLAQVDSNLATTTDLLDVYKSGGVKPEMVTMFDFSGSMTGVFWHRKYWTNVSYGTHIGGTPGDNTRLSFSVNLSQDNATNNTVTMNRPVSTWTTSSFSGYLVDAYGVRISGALTLAKGLTATHARMTASKKIGTVTYTRTIDMPFAWTVMKNPTTAPTGTGLPAWIDCIQDPDISSTAYIPYDNVYASATSVDGSGSTSLTSWFDFTSDYVDWMFFGTDTKGTSGSDNTGPSGTFLDDNGISPSSTVGFVIGGATIKAGTTLAGVVGPKYTFANGLPVGTRASFLKRAVLQTWFGNRDRVWWAYRFLDCGEDATGNISAVNYTTWGVHTNPRDLVLFKKAATSGLAVGYSDASVTYFQSRTPNNSTPLTHALANCYAQLTMNDAGVSIFDQNSTKLAVGGGGETPPACRNSYVILFTDGNANDSTSSQCGADGSAIGSGGGTWTTEAGIQSTFASYASLAPGTGTTKYFNLWSLAAVAAHGKPNATQLTSGSGTVAAFAPFRVMSRGSSATNPRSITTMTVGLCLAGTNSDTGGGKGPLLRAALFGDPKTQSYDVATAVPYGITGGYQANFFDATDPAYLVASLSTIIRRVVQANAGITAPAAPLVGLNLGKRAYLGRFESDNDSGGSIWKGDLLMTGLGLQSDGTVGLIDKYGAFAIDINANNAVASAATMLFAKGWKTRNIYTVIPGSEPALGGAGLDLTAPAQAFSDQNAALATNQVMGTTDATGAPTNSGAWKLIRFIRGANSIAQTDIVNPSTKSTGTPARTDIMGDVINSSPAAIEYDPALIPASSPLSSLWTSTYSSMTDPRFQIIFCGDNQGVFHAFGEVSGFDSGGVLHADLDELWAFVPSEFLNAPTGTSYNKLGQLMTGDPTTHIYTVDGSPVIYFNDAPVSGGVGNFKVDSADTMRVIVGLRKGGRSYYAFDVLNPGAPRLAWVLNPNTSTDPTIKTMGLATSSIGLAEVNVGSSNVVKDVVILGGGFSNNQLDALPIAGNPATKLGRSLLALDVLTGAPVKYYDFLNNTALSTAFPTIGAITAGGFPFQFFSGSGRAQRIYFGDQNGGVYALGSMKTLTTGAPGWRVDSSNIDEWTTDGTQNVSTTPANPGIRWIYKGPTTFTSGNVTASAPITSVPVAYRVTKAIPQFRRPSSSTNAPNMIPPAVGVTFGTGDRNDPMDKDGIDPVAAAPNRQIMVFDRQDSADLPTVSGLPSNVNTTGNAVTTSQLANLTTVATPGDTSYLGNNQYLGYYLNFHNPSLDPNDSTHTFYEKAYLSPLVINGGLIFSTFKPTTSGSTTTCAGAGITYTYRMCDALAPVFQSGNVAVTASQDRTQAGCSGFVFAWTNLAGDLTAIGSRLVIQSGQDPPASGTGSSSSGSSARIGSYSVPGGTNAFAPRSWRIVR